MKKGLSLILSVAMCFSLVACDSRNETSSNNEPQQSTTPEATHDPKPAEPVAIELTTENFTEYFELVEILDIPTNEFGEVDKNKDASIDFVFVLKPEYQEKFVDDRDYKSSYVIEWSYISRSQEGTFDYDTSTYTLGKELTTADKYYAIDPKESTDMDEVKLHNADSDLLVGEWIFATSNGPICYIEEFKEILRVQGTLYLYE